MNIAIIAAVSSNRAIGAGNRLPWHLPADLQRFKALTMGKPILMGRKTHESIGRALPGRLNIVLTHERAYAAEGCVLAHGWEEALAAAEGAAELMVIGGASLYAHFLPLAQRLYLTLIHKAFAGDVYFPPVDESAWREVFREDARRGESLDFDYSFKVMDRIREARSSK